MMVVVLDTGPIYDFVAAAAAHEHRARMPTGTAFRERQDLDDFRAFLNRHHHRLTVPGVAAEVSNLARSRCPARVAATMWEHFVSLMVEVRVEERHLPVETLHKDAAIFGPVDIALCAIARQEREKQHSVLVVTGEQNQIALWMARSEANVETPSQVLARQRLL